MVLLTSLSIICYCLVLSTVFYTISSQNMPVLVTDFPDLEVTLWGNATVTCGVRYVSDFTFQWEQRSLSTGVIYFTNTPPSGIISILDPEPRGQYRHYRTKITDEEYYWHLIITNVTSADMDYVFRCVYLSKDDDSTLMLSRWASLKLVDPKSSSLTPSSHTDAPRQLNVILIGGVAGGVLLVIVLPLLAVTVYMCVIKCHRERESNEPVNHQHLVLLCTAVNAMMSVRHKFKKKKKKKTSRIVTLKWTSQYPIPSTANNNY